MMSFRRTPEGGLQAYLPASDDEADDATVLFTLSERDANAAVVAFLRGPKGPPGPMGPVGLRGPSGHERIA